MRSIKKLSIIDFFTMGLIIICTTIISSVRPLLAAPTITSITGELTPGATITITGSGFGIKNTGAPRFFDTMEDVTLGALPAGFTVHAGVGTPVSASPSRGSSTKAMKFFADLTATSPLNKESWNRSVFDLGSGGAERIYISYWLYLDKAGTLCTDSPINSCQWQWKNTYIGGSPSAYTANVSNDTTIGIDNWIKNATGFFNVFALEYYNNLTSGGSGPGAPSDFYLFNQWQRIDIYIQRSSAPLTANGEFNINRIGRAPILNQTNIITHDSNDLPWRYVAMGQAITNVNENYVGNGGRVVWKAYFDDVYIDTTQTRIEICDANTWAGVTHCEIQKPTSWSNTAITIILNQGTFPDFSRYLYIIDSDGSVNANGYPLCPGCPNAPILNIVE